MKKEKKKIAHVLGSLDRGGVEVWLKNMLPLYIDKYNVTLILTKNHKGSLEEQFISHGISIKKIPLKKNLLIFIKEFYRETKASQYDIVHSHLMHFSGLLSYISYIAGVKTIVCHSHNDKTANKSNESFPKQIYKYIMRKMIVNYSNKLLSCSKTSGEYLFKSHSFEILPYGLDFSKFEQNKDNKSRKNILSEKEINETNLIIGHVGSFTQQKNHTYIIEIAKQLRKHRTDFTIILVGEGNLEKDIRKEIEINNLTQHFALLGGRDDIAQLMTHAFDVFIFPSIYEGLGIVALEAQAAGLKCLVSDTIPLEALYISELVKIIPLSNPNEWVQELSNSMKNIERKNRTIELSKSPFSREKTFDTLTNCVYNNRSNNL